ncbi:TonB-dependent siderophore receptor [Massilia sp. CFBP9026]|uniref:TonB-dependent siderophore receptor n=1 Tax=Massilia sp. CFBP9026 TaxID=3096536 RepID=UPI002A6B7D39|nr:TonB-dependent siderophore receptor [Massilia sp. CFBP9026]MDY0961798.1 TonB-dependent siderophore receptor [Massilia sp. CFBP9026]
MKLIRMTPLAAAIGLALVGLPAVAQQSPGDAPMQQVHIVGTAEQELKQAIGVSVITSEDIEARPPANDLAELIRTMPGVNLTGNSASGQYGNNRQIDLRGMGPENTLILVDGKPVSSRNSVRMGRSGERNTRGDTNWVPAEAVERIEVLRGPAAARYGSGAAGGVINIITKAPGDYLTGSVTAYALAPEHSEEGGSKRLGFNLSGPLAGKLSFRVFGNVNKTDADALALNATPDNTANGAIPPAGREGVRNRDIGGLLRWDFLPDQVLEFESNFSRQGNIYAGDRAVNAAGFPILGELANAAAETNVMLRRSAALTHRGKWGATTSRLWLTYEGTDNTRMNEGLAGGPEGSISDPTKRSTSELETYGANGEIHTPLNFGGVAQMLTAGFEARKEKLDDPYSMTQAATAIPGMPAGSRDGRSSAETYAVYVEDNIGVNTAFTLTPGLRFDKHSQFGTNWSPSLNASYALSPTLTLRGGVARAFKAPNLYQSNPNYLYYTRGNGCPVNNPNLGGGCYVRGNEQLAPETSVNKEIGIAWKDRGHEASLAYFHNDYKNKITGGMDHLLGNTSANGRLFQWENSPKAVVQGVEGNLTIPFGPRLKLTNNLTYMIENENKTNGEPLSVIPEYTLNSTLDWKVNARLTTLLTVSYYGKQEPRRLTGTGGQASGEALNTLAPYAVVGANVGYAFTPKLYLRTGINNLFDERLFRRSTNGSTGAESYNEPGRALFVNLTASF